MSIVTLTEIQKNAVIRIKSTKTIILALEMGLGKTMTVCQSIKEILDYGQDIKFLVVCPCSVLGFWRDEFAKVGFNRGVSIYHSTFSDCLPLEDTSVAICSYDACCKYDLRPFGGLVLDEAHDPLRNGRTRLYNTLVRNTDHLDYKIAITGTPMTNSALDIKHMFDWIKPGHLGSKKEFNREYNLYINRGFMPHAEPEHYQMAIEKAKILGDVIAHYLIYERKIDVGQTSFDMPLTLPEKQRNEYDEIVSNHTQSFKKQKIIKIGNETFTTAEYAHEGQRLKTLKQISEARGCVAGDGLAETHVSLFIETHLEDLLKRGPTAFFFSRLSQIDDTAAILDRLGIEYVQIRGNTPPEERSRSISAINTGKAKVFLGSEMACGCGISLSVANIIITGPNWTPTMTNQIACRGSRQSNPFNGDVLVFNIYAENTIEDAIKTVAKRKSAIIAAVLGKPNHDQDELRAKKDVAMRLLRHKRHLENDNIENY